MPWGKLGGLSTSIIHRKMSLPSSFRSSSPSPSPFLLRSPDASARVIAGAGVWGLRLGVDVKVDGGVRIGTGADVIKASG